MRGEALWKMFVFLFIVVVAPVWGALLLYQVPDVTGYQVRSACTVTTPPPQCVGTTRYSFFPDIDTLPQSTALLYTTDFGATAPLAFADNVPTFKQTWGGATHDLYLGGAWTGYNLAGQLQSTKSCLNWSTNSSCSLGYIFNVISITHSDFPLSCDRTLNAICVCST